MKQIIILAALVFAGVASAQGTHFGIKAGYLSSTWSSDIPDVIPDKNKSDFYAGGFVEHKFTHSFGLEADLLYANTGAKLKEGDVSATYNFPSVFIPVTAKYYPLPDLAILAGPFAILKLDANIRAKNVEVPIVDAVEQMLKEKSKTAQFGITAGAEYKLPLGIFIEGRYNFGLTKLFKDVYSDQNAKTHFFQIGLGYQF